MSATCDTSVLIPALAAWHPHHAEVRPLTRGLTHIPANVLLETYSVLTRLPAPHRVSAAAAGTLLAALPLDVVQLPAREHLDIVSSLAAQDIRGGAVYDALVAATAAHHSLDLLTRDRRAIRTYDAVGVAYRLV